MSYVVLIGTFTGWAMIGHVATKYAIRWRRQRRPPKLDPASARLERIARLEIACGVGLKYGAEALQGVRSRLARGEREYAEFEMARFGGSVKRECWACGENYEPNAHTDWYKRGEYTMFGDTRNPDRDTLDETLCPPCLANARAELDYGVPL